LRVFPSLLWFILFPLFPWCAGLLSFIPPLLCCRSHILFLSGCFKIVFSFLGFVQLYYYVSAHVCWFLELIKIFLSVAQCLSSLSKDSEQCIFLREYDPVLLCLQIMLILSLFHNQLRDLLICLFYFPSKKPREKLPSLH
jgi:hypothetical protein